MATLNDTPKIKQHFIATEYRREIHKKTGGYTSTLSLYEVLKKGEIKRLGFVTFRSASCRGANSEAWVRLQELKAVKSSIIKKVITEQMGNYSVDGIDQYYFVNYENAGVKLEVL